MSEYDGWVWRPDRVPFRRLRLAGEYNRPLRQSWVNTLVATFDPSIMDPLKVSHRNDGTYVIIDGQHRYRALERIGWLDRMIPCLVGEDMSIEEEARAFTIGAQVKKLDPIDRHNAAIVARDERALDIQKAIDVAGFMVRHTEASNAFCAIGAAEVVYDKFGYDILRDTMLIAKDAWGSPPNAVSTSGISILLNRYDGRVDRVRLVKVLSTTSASEIWHKATEEAGKKGGRTGAHAFVIVRDMYDKGLRSGKLKREQLDDG